MNAARRLTRAAAFTFAAFALTALSACRPRAVNATPEGAVRAFIEGMKRVNGDLGDATQVYALLSKRAQANLSARAQRYSAATGKTIAPEAMIAPSRFSLRFEPRRYTAQIAGPYALVEVAGNTPTDHAQVPCVLEDNAWRVDLLLPALPPVQTRPAPGGS